MSDIGEPVLVSDDDIGEPVLVTEDKQSTGPQFVQGREPTTWETIKNGIEHMFMNDPDGLAKAHLAWVDSEAYGIPIGSAYNLQNAISAGVKINPKAA